MKTRFFLFFGCILAAASACAQPNQSYNINIQAGNNLIANQLDHGGNNLSEIMPVAPDGSVVSKYDNTNGNWYVSTYSAALGVWTPPNVTLSPGEGAFFQSPTNFTLTLTGAPHVPVLPINIPSNSIYLLSLQTNDVGTYETITGTNPPDGATLFEFSAATQSYTEYRFLGGAWSPSTPSVAVGESVWIAPNGGSTTAPSPVPSLPVITQQPSDAEVELDGSTNFLVAASGTPPLSYLWRLNGNDIPGATDSTFTIDDAQATNAGSYNAVVYNAAGVVQSTVVNLTISGLSALPLANDLHNAGSLGASTQGSGTGSNVGATAQPGEPTPLNIPGGVSVWVRWQPDSSGIATFSTAGSGFDTLLGIFTGDTVTNLVAIAGDDDSAGFLNDTVSFNALAGVNYAIQVNGFYGATGNITLSWNLEITNAQVPVITTPPQRVTATNGENFTLTVATADPADDEYQWTLNGAPILVGTSANLNIIDFSPDQVGVYQVQITDAVSERSIVSFPVTAQLVSGFLSGTTNTDLRVDTKFQAAMDTAVTGDPYDEGTAAGFTGTQTFSYDNQPPTLQPNEPIPCGNAMVVSTFWPEAFLAPFNGLLTVDTLGSQNYTVLEVYTGSLVNFATLIPVAGSDVNATGQKVAFEVTAGNTYGVQIGVTNTVMGTINYEGSLIPAPLFTNSTIDINGKFSAQLLGVTNYGYVIQSATSLSPPNWANYVTKTVPLPTVIANSPFGAATFTDTITPGTAKFYRAYQVSPSP